MSKVLHVFDLDDSLMETPSFADFSGTKSGENVDIDQNFPSYFLRIKAAFLENLFKEISFKRMGDFVVPINAQTGQPFKSDVVSYFKNKRDFGEKDGVLVLNPFPGFHSDPETVGKIINEPIYQEYKKAENKMILTGRDKNLSQVIIDTLDALGMELPNYGLKTYKSGKLSIKDFKIQSILESIREYGWDIIHFYEDRLDWLTGAEEAVNQVYPSVNFVSHFVTNIKEKRSL